MDKTLRNYLTGILSGTDRALETFIQVTADSLSEQQLTRLTGTGGVNDKPIAEGIYVSRPTGSQTSEEEDTASLEEQDDLMEPAMGVIQEKRRVVVLGNPGSGKTTLLQYLMLRMASECYQAEGTGDVPVYISLKDLTTKNTLHAILADYRNDVFYPLLVNGQVVFLLDGLNEVQPHCLEKTMDDIRQLLNDYPHCGLVITSRLYGYTGEFDLPVYCLDDFSEDNIREYTHHRTGNTALYERILETEGLHSMAVNPLLLNMITSIWLTEDDLPKQRSRLYARFIEFQLNRGCITRREEQHSIINVLSRLAYEMRVGGQVCDDLDRLIKVIAIEDRESDVSGMLALLNRSGLLVMTGTGTCTAGVSFVHETFQEYFCALYINKEYERTRYVPVDLSRPEWLETLKLIGEEVLQHGTESRIIEFLTQVAAMFANGSITGFFNDRLAVTVRALTGMADESQLVRDWLDQYVFFHMQNFLKMSDRQATDSRFAAIVESLGMLHSKGLCKALFLSSRWQQRWMYDPLHLDAMNYTRYSARLEQVIKNLPKFSGKKDICLYLYDFHKENNCFEGINRVISILKNILSRNLNVEECKEVFELTGDYCALFCCTDLDYIEQKTRAVPGIHVPGIKHVFEGLSPESLFFLYGRLYDRFCESDRQVLLSSGFLYKMVLKAPGLDEVLLRSPKIKTALTGFLRSLYRIPMEFLSPYYRTFLDELREETVHKETSMEFRTICQGPDGRFVVETKDKRFAAELPAVTNFVRRRYRIPIWNIFSWRSSLKWKNRNRI